MTLEVLLTNASFVVGSLWKLRIRMDGFKNEYSDDLVTQAKIGRAFQLLGFWQIDLKNTKNIHRVKVRLLEDDYICWFEFSELVHNASKIESWNSPIFSKEKIGTKIPEILSWAKAAKKIPNKYLWGGTIGPDFDCSGLVQSVLEIYGLKIPRDSKNQWNFLESHKINLEKSKEGDLHFFGKKGEISHVGFSCGGFDLIHSQGYVKKESLDKNDPNYNKSLLDIYLSSASIRLKFKL